MSHVSLAQFGKVETLVICLLNPTLFNFLLHFLLVVLHR